MERRREWNGGARPATWVDVEAIFLVLEEGAAPVAERRPPASLAGLKIVGDIVAPAIDEADWAMSP
jgi:hypothetical protein